MQKPSLWPRRHDGREIRRRRQRRGITGVEFARRVGIHRKHLEAIEFGRRNPSVETLHRIASALDCEMSELLIHDEERAS